MTALKPLETLRVSGQYAGTYECNRTCAHPDCTEPVPDRGHHIFPRSLIGNGLYFVQAWDADGREMFAQPIPHVTGLCRPHHEAVERHDAWIKLEDGIFVWYDCIEAESPWDADEWHRVGPLDPQPGGREKARKRRRSVKGSPERRNRTRISIAVPADSENGGELWDSMVEMVKEKLIRMGRYSEGDKIPVYEALMAAFYDWFTSA